MRKMKRSVLCWVIACVIMHIYGPVSIAFADDHGNTPATATSVTVDGTPVSGSIETGGDVDYFSFSAGTANVYLIETGGNMDTVIYLYNTDGTTEIDMDDDGGPGLLSRIVWTAPSGSYQTYYVKVINYSPTGTDNYRLSITENPSLGEGEGEWEMEEPFGEGEGEWEYEYDEGMEPEVEYGAEGEVSDDHSDTWQNATPFTIGSMPIFGEIERPGDIDFFTFQALAGVYYTIETMGSIDTFMSLFGTNGTTLLDSDNNSGYGDFSLIVWLCQQAGNYFVAIRHNSGSGTGSFAMAISEGAYEYEVEGEGEGEGEWEQEYGEETDLPEELLEESADLGEGEFEEAENEILEEYELEAEIEEPSELERLEEIESQEEYEEMLEADEPPVEEESEPDEGGSPSNTSPPQSLNCPAVQIGGTALVQQLDRLREWRDLRLLSSVVGERVTAAYYRISDFRLRIAD